MRHAVAAEIPISAGDFGQRKAFFIHQRNPVAIHYSPRPAADAAFAPGLLQAGDRPLAQPNARKNRVFEYPAGIQVLLARARDSLAVKGASGRRVGYAVSLTAAQGAPVTSGQP
jgi:hypothetical protein